MKTQCRSRRDRRAFRPGLRGAFIALVGTALLLFGQDIPASAHTRVSAHRQGKETTLAAGTRLRTLSAAVSPGLLIQDMNGLTPQDLVTTLVGGGATTISNVKYTGAKLAAGRFSGGTGIIGFESGIILSTGFIRNVVGPNEVDDITGINGAPGDGELGPATFDAATLEFDFIPAKTDISFQYVFASDEYNEWANSDFNDVFSFFVNGVNRAFVPNTDVPVSINSINGGNPVGENPQNPEYFINNELPNNGLNTEMDGLTTVLTLSSPVNPGQVNHLKLTIADVGDNQWDSNVFLKAGSFSEGGDGAPPVTSALLTPAPNAAGWNQANVQVKFTALALPGDAVKEIHVQVGSQPELVFPGDTATISLTQEGSTPVSYYAVGASGLQEEPKQLDVQIDKTKPLITGEPYRAPNAYGWYAVDVPVSFTCTDSVSGIADCLGNTTLGEGANQSVPGKAVDKAGNWSTALVSGINIDKSVPTITGAPDRQPNADGWYNAAVTVTYTCSDRLSGVAACPEPAKLTAEGSNQNAGGTATDQAGNTASFRLRGLNVDLTAPVTSATAPTGWQGGDVTVTFSATDNLSGVKATYFTMDGGAAQSGTSVTVTAEGVHQIQYWSVDKAGNVEQMQTVTVQIDRTPPVVTFSGNQGTYAWNDQVTITCTASDTLSGVASTERCTTISGPASSFGAGAHTYTATATDFAGNLGTGSVTFTVNPPESTCALIDQWVPQHGVANSLCVKIRNSIADKARGSFGAAFNLLEAFKREVQAQDDKHILPGGKEVLLGWADTLEADLPPLVPDDPGKKNK